jgi:HAD superfamily hydrolase (TIGR01450 family)
MEWHGIMDLEPKPFFPWWRNNYENVSILLMDIDGTLLRGESALPGAEELLAWLRSHRFPFCLLTNDGNHSLQEKSRFLCRAGLDIAPDEIVSCSLALHRWRSENPESGRSFFVMGDLGKPDYAELAGFSVCRDPDRIDECDGIIVGEGCYDWQRIITAVMNSLRLMPNRPLLVPNPDSYWPSGKHGEIGIGAGGKARFICTLLAEMGISVSPTYLGKPYPAIFLHAVETVKARFPQSQEAPISKILMLGDSLRSDILGAKQLGMHASLVLTGICTREHVQKKTGPEAGPDTVFSAIL